MKHRPQPSGPDLHATAAGLLAYCRPGFEGECAQELARDASGFVRTERGSGFVELVRNEGAAPGDAVTWRELIFARQLLHVLGRAQAMSRNDRLASLLPIIEQGGERWRDAWVEAPDSDEGRELAPLCRALNAALVAALKKKRAMDPASPRRLHVCMTASDAAIVCSADVATSAPWPGGIPRLRFPRGAPSRSTLKLEEAFLVLLDEGEREKWLKPGMTAVDLGAAPGGWTWQLVHRSIRTTAIDNGPMDAALMESGIVEHRRADGFRYRPPRAVDWLVCDMVEQPRRIAELIARWLAEGLCRRAIFNLKLPMKKRYDEVALCLSIVADALGGAADLRAKQLYHDREEITVFATTGRPRAKS
ncbi:MAG TPA: 23S rRNA (cytidine(2498)-2'-O)-methyltransferase RlmM [Rhodanobacteraceae bacterium]|nr:23S rRNA (cytidine(2498)-2'-O)-methyltransferase RlmM [Rhodanobacteraceae bacterium]